MPVGVTLATLLDEYKAEAHISQNVAHGLNIRDAQKYLLARVQRELYTQHDWPMLEITKDITLSTGQRLYNYPVDIDFEFVNRVWVRNSAIWQPMGYGITPDDLNIYNSEDNFTSWPPVKWEHNSVTNQLEVWPVPDQTGTLRIEGRKKLGPLVADGDTCTLDSTLIVLYAAAETLAQMKSEAAPLKLQKAQAHFIALKRRQGANKRSPIILGGGPGGRRTGLRVGIDYVPPSYGKGN